MSNTDYNVYRGTLIATLRTSRCIWHLNIMAIHNMVQSSWRHDRLTTHHSPQRMHCLNAEYTRRGWDLLHCTGRTPVFSGFSGWLEVPILYSGLYWLHGVLYSSINWEWGKSRCINTIAWHSIHIIGCNARHLLDLVMPLTAHSRESWINGFSTYFIFILLRY